MSGRITVADALLRELKACGTDTVFGIISIHNIPFYDSLQRDGGFRVVTGRHEGALVNMADAYSRASGRLGVALTSTGTGAGNAAGALMEAINGGGAVLHITGNVASPYIDTDRGYIHDIRDQLVMLRAVSKDAIRLRRPEQAVGVFKQAIRAALRAPRGPVSVEIPVDFQAALIDAPEIHMADEPAQAAPDEAMARAADWIAQSSRPLIWSGGGVVQGDASDELTALARRIDAGVIYSQSGRGGFPDSDPRCIGHFATFAPVQEFIEKADLLISAGVRFRGNETSNWKFKTPDRHICIDIDPLAVHRNFPQQLGLIGDARLTLAALNRLTRPRPDPAFVEEVSVLQQLVRGRMRENIAAWAGILDALHECVPEDAIVVRDVTVQATIWGSRILRRTLPRTAIHASGGGIGQCLPMAIGAQCAAPDRVVLALAGDGGLLLNVGSLATLAEEQLPVVLVVFDDSAYGVLKNIQTTVFESRYLGTDLAPVDIASMGRSFGISSAHVKSCDEFRTALAAAIRSRRPEIVVVDANAIGPHRHMFAGPDGGSSLYKPH